jgi:hypothetical protein
MCTLKDKFKLWTYCNDGWGERYNVGFERKTRRRMHKREARIKVGATG